MQNLFVSASVFYLLIFMIAIIVPTKIKLSKGLTVLSFVVFSLSISVLVYYLQPPLNWDLTRHFSCLDSIRNSGISFGQFLFENKFAVGGSEFTSYVAFNVIRYLVIKISDNNSILPWLCVLIDYLIVSYIIIDWSKENNSKVKFSSFLLCFTFLPLVYAASGIRTALAAAIIGLGIYLYLYKEKKAVVFVILAIIAVTIHPVMLIAAPFVFLARYETGIKGYVIVFVVSISIDSLATLFLTSKFSYLARIAYLYKRYTSDDQFRGGRYCLFGDIFLICALLVIYLMKKKRCDKSNYRNKDAALYSFLIFYMCYILGNIGNYDMVLRPAYLLGVFAPVLVSLYANTGGHDFNHKFILNIVKLSIYGVCLYVCYRHTEVFVQGYQFLMGTSRNF